MDKFGFYKSLYDRELGRRHILDADINIPVSILTLTIGLLVFYLNQIGLDALAAGVKSEEFVTCLIGLILIGIFLLTSIVFLLKSYNNFFRGSQYRNFAFPKAIRKYELQLIAYNKEVESNDKIDFEDELINKMNLLTENFMIINDNRSLSLYKAKTCMLIALIFSGILLGTLVIKYIKI